MKPRIDVRYNRTREVVPHLLEAVRILALEGLPFSIIPDDEIAYNSSGQGVNIEFIFPSGDNIEKRAYSMLRIYHVPGDRDRDIQKFKKSELGQDI